MANGHVENHDPLSNQTNLTDSKSTSDTNDMDNTVEFRLLMAYAKRRRPTKDPESLAQDTLVAQMSDPHSTQTSTEIEKEKNENMKIKKKKRGGKHFSAILSCIRPQKKGAGQPQPAANKADDVMYRCGYLPDALSGDIKEEEKDELDKVASKLMEIADEIPFSSSDIEPDSEEDAVERVISMLLREVGDRLNEEKLKEYNITAELFWNYSFFETLIKSFLRKMGLRSDEPDRLGPQASPKSQFAVTCEVTSRLSSLSMLPSQRILNHGAIYLSNNYSLWAQQHGGYEEAFYSDEDDDQ